MAVLPGRSPRRIYVTAHYDSLARIDSPPPDAGPRTATGFYWNVTDNPAPGANDDGSGTALTIELARVFAQSGIDFDAIFNNDIVGGVSGGTGLANTGQHRVEDTLEGVSFQYLARNARVNAAGVATLALAPPAPIVTTQNGAPRLTRGDSGYDARLQWEASPGASSYRVYSRQAWAPDWEQTMDVGSVTEYVRPNVSIDDVIFGVSAVGPGGHESLVSAYVNPPRRPVTVKTLPD